MSFTLEYNRIIYKDRESGQLFLLNKWGANNVWDRHLNLRPSDWHLLPFTSKAEFWEEIGDRLYSIKGGMIQQAVGWQDYRCFQPMQYVKLYRSKLKNAKPLSRFFEDFELSYSFDCDEKTIPESWLKGFKEFGISPSLDGKYSGTKNLETSKELLDWIYYFPKGMRNENARSYYRLTAKKKRL